MKSRFKHLATMAAATASLTAALVVPTTPAHADAASCKAVKVDSYHTYATCSSGSGYFRATLRCYGWITLNQPAYVWSDGPWVNVGGKSNAYCGHKDWYRDPTVDQYGYEVDHG